ncbi:hypothetical protein SAMN05428959_106342 [Duganella sp. CF517]|uniref:hypothetical protein n=1 Tax=Duganella sp. CF517 TaxID=1881038 RepID=UPI0008BA02ED|nr:hypothetical protein [Duganella sp. CF517]SEO32953.1 hypothetical protein SAMN05428959_106342 [Duganella sp. CF517]
MRNGTIMRLVALVSYGTKFLRNEIALGDWQGHGVFGDARLRFRRQADQAVLAEDVQSWLAILGESGATRLSLHMFARFDIAVPDAMGRVEYAVAVHYADRHEIWAVEREGRDLPTAPRGADVDDLVCVETRSGALQVPGTNWKQVAAAIARDLDTNIPSSQVRAGPYYGPVPEQSPTRMPLLPPFPDASLASWILSSLDWQMARFANDMNPKNDYGSYARANQNELDALEDWGERLECWITEVLIRAANEAHGVNLPAVDGPLERICTPAMSAASLAAESLRIERQSPEPLAYQASPVESPSSANAGHADAQADRPPLSWKRVVGWLLAAVVFGVIVLAGIPIVADHPWAAAVAGVLWVLYRNLRKP